MAGVIRIIGTVMEALVVLSSNVAFVFKGIGTEIGGLAAQAVAFLSGNFEGVAAIHRQMQVDAAASRAELDKFQASVLGTTDRILQGREALFNHSQTSAENRSEDEVSQPDLRRDQDSSGGRASADRLGS